MTAHPYKPLTIRSLVLSAVLVPLLLAALVGATFYYTIAQLLRTSRELETINQSLSAAQRTLKLLVDMETGQRGFLIGGKREFLEPYDAAQLALPAALATLSRQIDNLDPGDMTVDRITVLTNQWQSHASRELLEKERGLDYVETFNAAKGKALMDRIRAEFDTLIARQEGRRVVVISSAASSAQLVLWGALLVALTAGGISAAFSGIRMFNLYERYLYQLELLDLAHDAILVRDPESRVQYWNSGAERTYGWAPSEAIGAVTHSLLKTVFPVSFEATESALRNEGKWEGELTHTARRGEQVTVQSRQVLTHTSSGRPRAILEINRDITAFKRYESELVKAKLEAEGASAAKTRFLADVSHELRTPLNTIVQQTGLAVRDEVIETTRNRLAVIAEEAVALRRLIDDLLSMSKLESGVTDLSISTFTLSAFLTRLSRLELASRDRQNVYTVVHKTAKDITLTTDQEKLFHCTSNLVVNALKFTRNGHVQVHVWTSSDDERLLISVIDDGPGISPEDEEHIFKPFWQGRSSEGLPGIGLGLSLSKRYADLLKGELSYQRLAPHGSRFDVTVPTAIREPT